MESIYVIEVRLNMRSISILLLIRLHQITVFSEMSFISNEDF